MREGAQKAVEKAFADKKLRWHFLAQKARELYYVTDEVEGIRVNASSTLKKGLHHASHSLVSFRFRYSLTPITAHQIREC